MKEPSIAHPKKGQVPFSQCPTSILQYLVSGGFGYVSEDGDLPDYQGIDIAIAKKMINERS